MKALRSALIWLAIVLLIALWVPLLTVIRLFDRDPVRYRTGRWFRRLGCAMTRVNPFWKVHIEGIEHVTDPRNPYVVVSNHQSMADIPVISCLPWEMKWVAKESLFRMPVVGYLMRLSGDIPVRRGDPQSREDVFRRAAWYLRHRCSVMFFAEGTRSRDGRVLPFKSGAFRLAIEEQVPVLPLAIDGAYRCLPKHGWQFMECEVIHLAVLPPVETRGLTLEDESHLREKVRQMIIRQIATWRGVSPEEVDACVGNKRPANEV